MNIFATIVWVGIGIFVFSLGYKVGHADGWRSGVNCAEYSGPAYCELSDAQ